jgi:hypothetical protein
MGTAMENSGEVPEGFYDAVLERDFVRARNCLRGDLVFVGLFETYRSEESAWRARQDSNL